MVGLVFCVGWFFVVFGCCVVSCLKVDCLCLVVSVGFVVYGVLGVFVPLGYILGYVVLVSVWGWYKTGFG